jgi:hypothetical protein
LKYIVEASTPVPFFGDINTAKFVTIGINPSSNEFTKMENSKRYLLTGDERRLADLKYLGVDVNTNFSDHQIEEIWKGCLNYFDGPFYAKWFSKMQETVLSPVNGSYKDRSAVHLDLVQWATDPLWKDIVKLDKNEADRHLAADIPFLFEQINNLDVDFYFLSGATVVDALKDKFKLELYGKTEAKGKDKQYSLFKGEWKKSLVLGSTMNIPDSHTSNAHRAELSKWIRSEYLTHFKVV